VIKPLLVPKPVHHRSTALIARERRRHDQPTDRARKESPGGLAALNKPDLSVVLAVLKKLMARPRVGGFSGVDKPPLEGYFYRCFRRGSPKIGVLK